MTTSTMSESPIAMAQNFTDSYSLTPTPLMDETGTLFEADPRQ